MSDKAKFFEKAAADVLKHVKSLDDNGKLKLYGLYKQATVGDCNTDKPGFLDFKGKAKWEAWNKVKGKDKEVAKQEYVEYVLTLLPEDIKKEYN